MPIADLHCDLLSYLADGAGRSVEDPVSRCSLQQMQQGGLFLQTLALFTKTGKGSVDAFKRQVHQFHELLTLYPLRFAHATIEAFPEPGEKIHLIGAIENASGLIEESERLDLFFSRFERYEKSLGAPLYMSLTWNGENRFGGGNEADLGLTRDGEIVLEFLHGKGTAIDLSHTSDPLAYGIIAYIDRKNLDITPIASHSNCRHVRNHPRNLPDSLIKEVFARGGIVGMNFVEYFIGKKDDLVRHIEHLLTLGGEDKICFGADFFCTEDYHTLLQSMHSFYYKEFSDASSYPRMLEHLSVILTNEQKKKLSYQNLHAYFKRKRYVNSG